MSRRTMARSSPNMNSASARASSVFPTPVGPRKTNEPIGRFGSCKPERARRSALATASTALCCPTTRWCSRSSMWISFSVSPSSRRETGIPVQRPTTSATSSSSTSSFPIGSESGSARFSSSFSRVGSFPYLISATRCRSPCRSARSACIRSSSISRLIAAIRWRLPHSGILLAHRRELDLELADAPLGLVELEGGGVDLHPQARGGLVDEVDRLVGEEPVRDVAVGEDRGRDERRVTDANAVVRLVALLQAAENGDRVHDGRLADEDRLEASLEGRVLLDVLAVLVERRRADRAQLAAREHRLQQIRGVDGALGGARANDRVQLVDEQDDLALAHLDLLEDGLDPLLELAAVLRAGEERADVERPHALALEALGHVARDDALCEALGDRGLPHSGVADQHRVVLRPPREHLDDAADLLVAADDRVELALFRELGEVAAELLERLVRALGVLRGDPLASADFLERSKQLAAL